MIDHHRPTLDFSPLDAPASRRSFLHACLAALASATAAPSLVQAAAGSSAADLLKKPTGGARLRDFTFFHFSDSHIDPRLAGTPFNPQGRSIQALAWLAERTGRPIRQRDYDLRAEPPHFAIHTGDVFEYSIIDHTWNDLERATAHFHCPIAPVPGNHDNTWGEINRELRQRFGDENYSFDYAGCHFVGLNSAGLLDPLPAWDRRTLAWLADDLTQVDRATPVFLAMHHPLTGNAGYASPFDRLRFWDVIQHHNVALIMDGHWHTVHKQQWQGLDRVNGGATFGAHTGYNSLTVRDNMLRVVFHYWQENDARPEGRTQVALLEKPLTRAPMKRPFRVTPTVRDEVPFGEPVVSRVNLTGRGQATATAWIDDAADAPTPLAKNGKRLAARLTTDSLTPGWHYVTVRVVSPPRPEGPGEGLSLDLADAFWLAPPADAPYRVHRFQNAAAIKTQPVVADELVLVGDTAGTVTALSLDLQPAWRYETGSQIVHSLAVIDGLAIVGDVDGRVHALRVDNGERVWKTTLPNAVYAAAAFADGAAIIADAAGFMHALALDSGKPRWSRKVAEFAFEAQPLVHGDLLLAGAWDARLYALRHATGELAWKAWCPTWHVEFKSRYYAPADCSPLLIGEHVFVTDRGWRLGRYSLDGKFLGVVREQVSAIAPGADNREFYSRGLDNQLVRYAADGAVQWSHATPLGRAPTPPAVLGQHVAAVSDTGHLCVADAATGRELFALSISPSLFVLSGLGTDAARRLFAADMDGRLTGIEITLAT